MSYFILHSDEDGLIIEKVTKEKLLKRITPTKDEGPWYGTNEFFDDVPNEEAPYWKDKLLIIKGEVIVPKSKQTVTEFVVE